MIKSRFMLYATGLSLSCLSCCKTSANRSSSHPLALPESADHREAKKIPGGRSYNLGDSSFTRILYEGCAGYYDQHSSKQNHDLVTKTANGFRIQDPADDKETYILLEKSSNGEIRGLLAMSSHVFKRGYIINSGDLPSLLFSFISSKSTDPSVQSFQGGFVLKGVDGKHNPGVFVKDDTFASFEIEERLPAKN